jgi:hypothetical protein
MPSSSLRLRSLLVPLALTSTLASIALAACESKPLKHDNDVTAGTPSGGAGASAGAPGTALAIGGDAGAPSAGGSATVTLGGGGQGGAGEIPESVAGAAGEPALVFTPGISFIDYVMPVDITPNGGVALIEDPVSTQGDLYFYDVIAEKLSPATSVGDPSRDLATGLSATLRISAFHDDPVQASLWSKADGWHNLGSSYASPCEQDISAGFDVSANGKVTVGLLWNGCNGEAFRWDDDGADGTMTPLEVIGSPAAVSELPPTNRASVVSDDGQVAAGFAQSGALDRTPALWDAEGHGTLLDPNNVDAPGEVMSISADGAMVAGQTGYDGFYWTKGDGMVSLGRLETALPSDPMFPEAIAADQQLIFGASGDEFSGIPVAFVWTKKDGIRPLQDLVTAANVELPEGMLLSGVMAASADGSVLLGSAFTADFVKQTFVLRLPVSAYGL